MEGHWEENLNNKGHFHALFMESLDNAFISLDTPISPDSPPALSPSLPPTLDDDVVLAPLANLCVPTFTPNTDFDFDLYSLCVHSLSSASSSHFAFPTISFMTSALASMMSLYNALLDSGCMHHIIRDHALFSNYVSSSISVGTANCGSLEALGTGGYPYHTATLSSHCAAASMLLRHQSTSSLWMHLSSMVCPACSLLVGFLCQWSFFTTWAWICCYCCKSLVIFSAGIFSSCFCYSSNCFPGSCSLSCSFCSFAFCPGIFLPSS